MNTYAAVLLWAIPAFFVLVLIEIAYGHFTKNQTYTFMDTLASLSSGMTNVIKDVLGLAFILISYPFILKHLGLFTLESSIPVYVAAFICIDFASYWVHRLNHKVNIYLFDESNKVKKTRVSEYPELKIFFNNDPDKCDCFMVLNTGVIFLESNVNDNKK